MAITTESSTGSNSNMCAEALCSTTELVKENPGLSMLVVFGIGVAVGALVGESMPHMATCRHRESTAERIGRQICEALNIKL